MLKNVLTKVAIIVIACAALTSSFAFGTVAQLEKSERDVKKRIELHNSVMYETEQVRPAYYGASYLPGGYEEYASSGNSDWHVIAYKNEIGNTLRLFQYMEGIPIPEIDRFADIYEKEGNGLYVFNSSTGKSYFVWSNLGYVFELRADDCSKEELLKIAENLIIV
jgi:hypothetical protein